MIIIINVSCALNQHIRMIYERSCDNEDWSNDKIYILNTLQYFNITVFAVFFYLINAALMSIRDFF